MTVVEQEDFIQSIFDASQFISYYHPKDYIQALYKAYRKEKNPTAKDMMAQILVNSHMYTENHRPIYQDTGIATVFSKVGMDVQWDAEMNVQEMVNGGVRRAYTYPDSKLRTSILADPAGERQNTKDNTPVVVHMEIVKGDKVEVTCATRGDGPENKIKVATLNPSDNIVDWVLRTIPQMGTGWYLLGTLGIGTGGMPEKAVLVAKKSLMSRIDIQEFKEETDSGAESSTTETLRLESYKKVNALDIGTRGLGGLSTVLDVKILDYPTRMASESVVTILDCAATRYIEFKLDGSGPAKLEVPSLEDRLDLTYSPDSDKRVDVSNLTKEEVATWKTGDMLLLSGKILTNRNAAHKHLVDMLNKGEELPVGLTSELIYYIDPVDPVRDEVVGPTSPTTSTRMDKFTCQTLEQTGLLGMIGKFECGTATCQTIADNKAVYLVAVGGAAYLVAKATKASKVLAFPELGMEAIYEFGVKDIPVTAAVDSNGESVHAIAPKQW